MREFELPISCRFFSLERKFGLKINIIFEIVNKIYSPRKIQTMNGIFDIKSPNWLGGNNVHNTLIILGVGYLVYKAWSK